MKQYSLILSVILLTVFFSCDKQVKRKENKESNVVDKVKSAISNEPIILKKQTKDSLKDSSVNFISNEHISYKDTVNFNNIYKKKLSNEQIQKLSLGKVFLNPTDKESIFYKIHEFSGNSGVNIVIIVNVIEESLCEFQLISYNKANEIINNLKFLTQEYSHDQHTILEIDKKDILFTLVDAPTLKPLNKKWFYIDAQGKVVEDISSTIVIKNLNLSIDSCYIGGITKKELPYSKNKSVIVVPVEAYFIDNEDKDVLHDIYIALYETSTNKILVSKYINHEDTWWYTDGFLLNNLRIDNSIYKLNEKDNFFGITVDLIHHDKTRKFLAIEKSLYIYRGVQNSIEMIAERLPNYTYAKNNFGEYDEMLDYEKIVNMSINKNSITNSFFDIIISRKDISYSEEENRTIKFDTDTLRYDGSLYKRVN